MRKQKATLLDSNFKNVSHIASKTKQSYRIYILIKVYICVSTSSAITLSVITMGTHDWRARMCVCKRPWLNILYLFCHYVAVSLVGSYRQDHKATERGTYVADIAVSTSAKNKLILLIKNTEWNCDLTFKNGSSGQMEWISVENVKTLTSFWRSHPTIAFQIILNVGVHINTKVHCKSMWEKWNVQW